MKKEKRHSSSHLLENLNHTRPIISERVSQTVFLINRSNNRSDRFERAQLILGINTNQAISIKIDFRRIILLQELLLMISKKIIKKAISFSLRK